MAGSFNRVIVMGNLTRDVEMRTTPNGTSVSDIGVAINEKRKNAQGEVVEDTTFVDITLWGRNAEVAAEYLGKGSAVLVEGKLRLDQWTSKEGEKRQKIKVVCDRMQMVGARKDGDQSTPPKTKKNQNQSGNTPSEPSPGMDDDIPF